MFCSKCGTELDSNATVCSNCGNVIQSQTNTKVFNDTISQKSRLVAFLLAFFVGSFGIHNFYLGRITCGVIQLILTLTLLGLIVSNIWVLVDWIMILAGSMKDKDGKLVKQWID